MVFVENIFNCTLHTKIRVSKIGWYQWPELPGSESPKTSCTSAMDTGTVFCCSVTLLEAGLGDFVLS